MTLKSRRWRDGAPIMLRVWLVTLCVLLSGVARASEWPVADLAMLADPSGKETIESVSDPARAAEFVPLPKGFSVGYTRTVHWLRFTLRPPPEGKLFFEIRPPFLDDLQLYVPDGAGGFRMRQGGDSQPFAARDFPGLNPVFLVELHGDAPQTFYLRVETSSTSYAQLRAWRPADYPQAMAGEYVQLGLYYGLMLAMLLILIWHGHWRHDPAHRAMLAYLLAMTLLMLGMNGFVAQYLAPAAPWVGHHWVSVMVFATIGLAAHFHRALLAIGREWPFAHAYFRGVIGLTVLGYAGYAAGYFTEAARIVTISAILIPFFGFMRTTDLHRHHRAGTRYMMLGYAISFLSYLIGLLAFQGILPQGSALLYHTTQYGILLTFMAFNLALFEQQRQAQREHLVALAAAEQARRERDQEALARERQGALLAMLTHELRMPLSVIRLSLGARERMPDLQARADRAVAEIDSIIERCAFVTRLDEGRVTLAPKPCEVLDVVMAAVDARDAGERIQLALTPGFDGELRSDPVLLRVIIDNLLDNALKYSPAASLIAIELADARENEVPGIMLSVTNDAGAVGRPDPALLFNKYYRAPHAHGQSGSGLGLYIVRALVERLDGRILCRGDETKVVFELWLPRNTC